MPRYYFDTADDDHLVLDKDGQDVADMHEAHFLAIDALPDMARQSLPDGDRKRFRVIVRDEDGERVLEAELCLTTTWLGHSPEGPECKT